MISKKKLSQKSFSLKELSFKKLSNKNRSESKIISSLFSHLFLHLSFRSKSKTKAFTIIEISIVIMISAIILAGSFSALKTGMKNAAIKTTNSNLTTAYEKIGEFLEKNSRLPCPSPLLTSMDSGANFGLEARSSNSCNGNGILRSNIKSSIVYGGIPVRTLGISDSIASDGYGNKLVYVVDERLTRDKIINLPSSLSSPTPSESFGTLPDSEISIQIFDVFPNGTSQRIFSNAAIILLSHGPNMYGAYPLNQSNSYSSSTNTSENVNSSSSANFTRFFISDRTQDSVFDDIVIFKSREQIVYETDDNLKSLIACDGSQINSQLQTAIFPQTSIYYSPKNNTVVNGVSNCLAPYQSTRPQIKCLDFGKWGTPSLCPSSTTTSCKIPSVNDEILKNSVVLESDPTKQGYSFVKNGTTYNIWSAISPGSLIANENTMSGTYGPSSVSVRCQNGKLFASWL